VFRSRAAALEYVEKFSGDDLEKFSGDGRAVF
jgi:hypothetical protein